MDSSGYLETFTALSSPSPIFPITQAPGKKDWEDEETLSSGIHSEVPGSQTNRVSIGIQTDPRDPEAREAELDTVATMSSAF